MIKDGTSKTALEKAHLGNGRADCGTGRLGDMVRFYRSYDPIWREKEDAVVVVDVQYIFHAVVLSQPRPCFAFASSPLYRAPTTSYVRLAIVKGINQTSHDSS